MNAKLRVRRIGNSLGFTMPKAVVDLLRVKEGDELHVVAEPGSGIRLSPYDPSFEAAVEAFATTRSRYRNALRELAR